jgi:SAM-dependent methyltransferase
MSAKQMKIDPELLFTREVLKLRHLHLGLSTPGKPMKLEDVAKAQTAFTELVLEKLGRDVAKNSPVLDVGCGGGAGTAVLVKEGYKAEGLSPDPYHEIIFRQELPEIPFHATTFESFAAKPRFGSIVFSESSHYVNDIDLLFRKCKRLLVQNGAKRVVIADYFAKPGKTYLGGENNPIITEDNLMFAAKKHSFYLTNEEDITTKTLPTIELIANFHKEYFVPGVNILERLIKNRAPYKWKIAQLFFGRKIEKLKQYLTTNMARRLDPEAYLDKGCYKVYTFNLQDC